jgi:hypothetical protein
VFHRKFQRGCRGLPWPVSTKSGHDQSCLHGSIGRERRQRTTERCELECPLP